MGFRNPITTAEDPVARQSSAAAQQAANSAQSTADQAVSSASAAAQEAANAQITANTAASSAQTANAAATAAQGAADQANTAAAAAQSTAAAARQATTNIGPTQIADAAITTPKLATGSVTAGAIAAGAVQAASIAAGAVQAASIAAGAVQAASIAAGAIDGKTITGALIRTAASGQRVQMDSTNGLVGVNSAGLAVTQIDPSTGVLVASGAQIVGQLDTGNGVSNPGVKITNKPGQPATGSVEWRTGTMDPSGNATAQLTGGGSGGSAFTLQGGQTQQTQAPQIGLNVEGLAAGGYAPVLRLKAGASGQIVQDVASTPLIPRTALTLPFGGTGTFQPYGGINVPAQSGLYGGGTGSSKGFPTVVKLASGLVVVTGMVTAVNLSFGIGALVATLPAGCAPAELRRFILQGWGNGGWIAEVAPSGAITYAGALAGSSPAGGSFLSLAGMTFDTVPELP